MIIITKAVGVVAAMCTNFGLCTDPAPNLVRTVTLQSYVCAPPATKRLAEHMEQQHGAFPRGYMFALLGCEKLAPDHFYSRSLHATIDYMETEEGVGIFFYTD